MTALVSVVAAALLFAAFGLVGAADARGPGCGRGDGCSGCGCGAGERREESNQR